jgi:hypothetical protein
MDGGEGGVLTGWKRGQGSLPQRVWEALRDAGRARAERRAAAPSARPTPAPEPRFPRSRLGAALEARLAVRGGVRLEDFLRQRLARYAGRLPEPLEALPATIEIEGGEPVVRARTHPGTSVTAAHLGRPEARETGERWLLRLADREGPSAVREVRELEAALGELEGRAAEARRRIQETSRPADVPAVGAVEATPEQLGRPPVPAALPIQLLRGFSLALLAAEAHRLAGPVLDASGFAGLDVASALARAPIPAGLGLVFAAGAAAAVFTFLEAAVQRLAALTRDPAVALRGRMLGGLAAGAAALAAGVAAATSAPARLGEPVLLVAVPLAAVLLLRQAAALAAVRAVAEAAALEWDRARTGEARLRAGQAEAVALAEEGLRRVEAERTEVRRRLRAIERRALESDRVAAAAAAEGARRLDRLAEALAAALELDRYAYLKVSAARSHGVLSRPARPEHPPRLESAERFGVAG